MLKGIDISNYQKGIDVKSMDADFIIAKATEGLNFVDKYCDGFIHDAVESGKLFGFYHFAHPKNDAIEEADFFYQHCKNYFHKGIPFLDWEAENQWDVLWAKKWLDRIYELTGVRPIIYMSESVVNAHSWYVVASYYALWVAKYRDNQIDFNYDMAMSGNAPRIKCWRHFTLWQWTSSGRLNGWHGNLDCNVFYGDKESWMEFASPSNSKVEDLNMDLTKIKNGLNEKIKIGNHLIDLYAVSQSENVCVISANQIGKADWEAVADIHNIDTEKSINCKINFGMFIMSNGQHLGVEKSETIDLYPNQSKYLVFYEYEENGKLTWNWGKADSSGYAEKRAIVKWSITPYAIINKYGQMIVSDALDNSYNRQPHERSVYLWLKDGRRALAIVSTKVTLEQCGALFKDIAEVIVIGDGGGSTQMRAFDGQKSKDIRYTKRPIANVIAAYTINGGIPNYSNENVKEIEQNQDRMNNLPSEFETLKTAFKQSQKECNELKDKLNKIKEILE